jgi:CTP:molybdopterin cytidylyltransferase MocA
MSRSAVIAAITAAGASERMGRAKALLPWRRTTILSHIISTLQEARVDPVLVITGAAGREIAAEATRAGAQAVNNDDWKRGRFASVQAAARFAHSTSVDTSLLLWPVDCPEVKSSTVLRLLEAAGDGKANVVPTSQGRAGHPVLLCPRMVAMLRRAPRDSNLRVLLRQSDIERRLVEVDDPAVFTNLNTLEDYERARQGWAQEEEG